MLPADSGPWCVECGSPATFRMASMDPRRPLGSCRRGCGRSGGVSRVLVSYLAADRLEAQRRYHRRMSTRNHARHTDRELASPYCDNCNRLGWSYPPAEPGTATAGTSPAVDATGRRA